MTKDEMIKELIYVRDNIGDTQHNFFEACPVKSVDGLIKKLMEFRDYLMENRDIASECIRIVKEYCEVKEKE